MTQKFELPAEFVPNAGTNPDQVDSVFSELGRAPPEDYRNFLCRWDGGEGLIGENYVVLWRLEELQSSNLELEVAVNVPELCLFGGDGGGEAFGFDHSKKPPSVVLVTLVGMERAAVREVARSFTEFLRVLEEYGPGELF